MALLEKRIVRFVAVLLALRIALYSSSTLAYVPDLAVGLCRLADGSWDATRDYAYAYDGAGNVVQAGRIDATGEGRAAFEADGFNFHAVRRWNAIDLVGVARADAQILVNQQPVLRDGRRFVFALPLREGSSAHVTNLTVLARVSDDDEEWVAQQSVTLRVPACPEEIGTTLAGATVSDSLTEYLFDARNRLRRVTDKIGEPRLQAVYDYYADDRRARKVVSVWTNDAWQASCTNQFIYDRWTLVEEVRSEESGVRRLLYTWGLDLEGLQDGTWGQEAGGIGGLLAITEVTGASTNIFLPICDHVGTIHALVAAMTNSVVLSQPCVVETRTYSPYGELIEVDAPLLTTHHSPLTSPCPFGFQSKYYDPETGFWNFGYRYYDAKSCKWLTADPLQEAGGLNLTAFCGGDPVNQIDPLGLDYRPVMRYDEQGGMIGFDYMQYVAPVGTPGTGYSLHWFNNFKRLGMVEGDAFDQRFENVLHGASAQYRFGDLSEIELREAISRGYVAEWDIPLLAHRERSGDWAVAMSGREVVKGAVWQAGLAVGGQALAAFWRLFKVPAALGPANSRLATTKNVTGEGQSLFRVVNDAERAGIDHCGRFSFPREGSTPTGQPGKFFWGSIDEAKQFQSYWYRNGESSHLLRTTIKPDAKPWLGPALTDGIGHPYFVDMLDLTAPIYWVQ